MDTLEVMPANNCQLPRWHEIPKMGLFLEQTVRYLNDCFDQLDDSFQVTPAMISNYVKMKIITNPAGKTYTREQIAYLIYLSIMKNVLPLTDITKMFAIQKKQYSTEVAYNYFCDEFANVMQYVFTNQNSLDYVGGELTPAKLLLKNAILAIVYKIFVKKQLALLAKD